MSNTTTPDHDVHHVIEWDDLGTDGRSWLIAGIVIALTAILGIGAAMAFGADAHAADEPAPDVATTVATTADDLTAVERQADRPEPLTAPSIPCPVYHGDDELPIGPCSKGETVREFQKLILLTDVDTVVDGYFGPQTEAAVYEWEYALGLTQDGVIDQELWDALAAAVG